MSKRLREVNLHKKIVTNSPALIQFFTLNAPYRTFDGRLDPAIGSTTRYGDFNTPPQKVFREECAALVIFYPKLVYLYNPEASLYFPPEAYGVTTGLTEVFSDSLGKIFLYPGCQETP